MPLGPECIRCTTAGGTAGVRALRIGGSTARIRALRIPGRDGMARLTCSIAQGREEAHRDGDVFVDDQPVAVAIFPDGGLFGV
jgi:hypothetical protein